MGRAPIAEYAMPDLRHVRQKIVQQTYREVLPSKFDSTAATVLLLAIGLQESRFEHRTQIGGPAHGFWQFERGGGVRGVLEHKDTRPYALAACAIRGAVPTAEAVYRRIVDDDLLACAFARLLLWSDPHPLPAPGEIDAAWHLYLRTWRPGRPHSNSWRGLYEHALEALA